MSLKYTELSLPFTVAEVGMNHDGSMGSAINYIKALENTGVSAVKFQMHIADSESSNQEKFRVKVFPQDETRFEYWKRTSFTVEQWREIKKQADESGLIFFATPFSVKAVELLAEMQVKIWKVASGEVSNWYLLDAITEQEGTVLLSSGMSSFQEIDENVDYIIKRNGKLGSVLQCTSSYPVEPNKVGLNVMVNLSERYGLPPGISDHSGRPEVASIASYLGCKVFEFHVRLSKFEFGPDISSSIDISKVGALVDSIKYSNLLSTHVIKDEIKENSNEMRELFCPKLVAKRLIKDKEKLAKVDFETRKGNLGVPAYKIYEILGKKLKGQLAKGEFLEWSQISDN